MFLIFKNLWIYRGFILTTVYREYQTKYRNSLLGGLWNLINPLAMIFIYTIVFSKVMQARLAGVENQFGYSIYLCAGVLTWGLFTEILNRSQNIFIENANLIKKISFPRLCLPSIVVISALLNFAIVFVFFVLFLIVAGKFPGVVILAIIPVLMIQVMFAIGLGISLGILNVFFRDVGQFFTIFLQFWFWLTPIVYSVETLPEYARVWIALNPMSNVVMAYQQIFINAKSPDWINLLPVTLISLLLVINGLYLFRKYSGEMVDEL